MRLVLLLLFAISFSEAKDFGTIGESYPIQEKSLISFIQDRISNLTEDEIANIHQRLQDHYSQKLQEPKPVENIRKAKTYEARYFDPTISVSQDIKDHEGNVIVHKGTKVNPLKINSLSQDLIFFDGSDPEQVDWAKKQKGAWILIKGKPLDLEETERRATYFDQEGSLTTKFQITSIPTKVSQQGLFLKIESFPMGESA